MLVDLTPHIKRTLRLNRGMDSFIRTRFLVSLPTVA